MTLPAAILKPRKAQPFHSRHPWVLDTAIEHLDGDVKDGQEICLLSDKRRWIARGIYNSQSRIRVRLYTWDPDQRLTTEFWRERIREAVALRRDIGRDDSLGAVRLVFSEADQLSGLIVDRFGDHLIVQANSRGIADRLPELTEVLQELLRPKGIWVKVDPATRRKERFDLESGQLWGDPPAGVVFIEEHGIRYGVEITRGQKTGFYLDQRENRRIAAQYLRNRSVLDVCCYTGGFSLAALRLGHASQVLGVDSSEHAIALARANAELNGIHGATFEVGEMFHALDRLANEGRHFDALILDPPRFAASKSGIDAALRAYHRLNSLALAVLKPRGVLVTCSCSGNISAADFGKMLFGVSTRAKRGIQLLHRLGAAPDHPTLLSCPETEYLKCFICRVL